MFKQVAHIGWMIVLLGLGFLVSWLLILDLAQATGEEGCSVQYPYSCAECYFDYVYYNQY